jgi:hypothetical protein
MSQSHQVKLCLGGCVFVKKEGYLLRIVTNLFFVSVVFCVLLDEWDIRAWWLARMIENRIVTKV